MVQSAVHGQSDLAAHPTTLAQMSRRSSMPPYWAAAALRRLPRPPRDGALQTVFGITDQRVVETGISLQIREALNEPRLMIVKAERNS